LKLLLPRCGPVEDPLQLREELVGRGCAHDPAQQMPLRIENKVERDGAVAVAPQQLLSRRAVHVVFGRYEVAVEEVADLPLRENLAVHLAAGVAPDGVKIDKDPFAALDGSRPNFVRRTLREAHLRLGRRYAAQQQGAQNHRSFHRSSYYSLNHSQKIIGAATATVTDSAAPSAAPPYLGRLRSAISAATTAAIAASPQPQPQLQLQL